MPGFSRTQVASASGPCVACCQGERTADDQLSRAAQERIAALAAHPGSGAAAFAPGLAQGAASPRVPGPCAQQAAALAPRRLRFDRYREALPAARAAADLSDLGDAAGDAPARQPCITRLPVRAPQLAAALGLPPEVLSETDLRNDATGFRAAMYRDEQSGHLILLPRDTQPDSLVDWETNTRNGVGIDTLQYAAMRRLTVKLGASAQGFDIAGYSKGGGLAQEGGLISKTSQVRVFNAAGLPDAALSWTRQPDFESLIARTRAFSAEGDFLTFMNDTTDPGQNILNAHFLQRELAGAGPGVHPIEVQARNPELRGQPDPAFARDKADYLRELGTQIERMQSAFDGGAPVPGFPAVRAALKETVANSMTEAGALLGAASPGPTLGKLAQHPMSAVLGALESDVAADRQALRQFLVSCG